MGYWDIYNERLTINGSNQRERNINRLKQSISSKAPSNPSYKQIELNGEDTHLVINSGTKPYYKEFQALPNQTIHMGDYVNWNNNVWIVYESDTDDEVYVDGIIRICNYKLHWQNESGEIISRYAHVLNASAYNNGEKENKTLTLQSNQFMVYLPYDNETMLLDDNKRIHMSKNIRKCKPYEITRIDDISYDFTDKGLINLIFTQTLASPGNDKLVDDGTGNKAWICDYKEPTTPSSPTDTDDEEPNKSPILLRTEIVYKGNPELMIGGTYKAFTGKFYDESNSEVNDVGVWSIDTIDELSKFVDFATTGNTIKIKILNYDSAICGIVRLKYSSSDGKFSKILDVSIMSGI